MSKFSPSDRKSAPVFVMGCHRSGTNLLYDMLLSSGGFAIYRGFLPIYKILIPRFGSMENPANRAKILETWLRSKGFRRTGLNAEKLSARIMNECHNGGDFIRVVMDSVAESQQMPRWAVYDPDNVLHVERVKRDIAEHLLSERDNALSVQVLQEFYMQATRVSRAGALTHDIAVSLIRTWLRFPIQNISVSVMGDAAFPADFAVTVVIRQPLPGLGARRSVRRSRPRKRRRRLDRTGARDPREAAKRPLHASARRDTDGRW